MTCIYPTACDDHPNLSIRLGYTVKRAKCVYFLLLFLLLRIGDNTNVVPINDFRIKKKFLNF